MPQQTTAEKMKNTETEVAVLQVQYINLTEKVDDVKLELKEMKLHFDGEQKETRELIKEFQSDTKTQHKDFSDKISSLEKWKWMIMGGAILAGSLGSVLIDKLFKFVG